MTVAMQYERDHERTPEDVSAQNLGFDVRSTDAAGSKRYTEVKARAKEGAIALTQNEWFKAKRFGDDYYLYVVLKAATQPQVVLIQNPTENLEPEEKVQLVRYIMSVNEIKAKGILE